MINYINNTEAPEYVEKVKSRIGSAGLRAYVFTFGCQQNEADSERIRGLAVMMGYSITDKPDDADLIILNTCAIREHAEKKVLSMLGRFKALKVARPDMIIGVAGCMAGEMHNIELFKRSFRYVSFTVEPNMLHTIPRLIYDTLTGVAHSFVIGKDIGDITEGMPTVRADKYQAWVSVMYGCNNFCSYCIVPYVRGRERSRRSEDIIDECRELVNDGVREITLLGQNVNSYCSDTDFAGLLSRVADIDGDFIIRFMTSHPKDVSDKLIEVIGERRGKIAPYFHLPLQSGSDFILKKMNRTYSREKYLNTVKKLRDAVPGIALSTDIIVGFPGESNQDFEDTLSILREVQCDFVYSFIYSSRKGTPASKMPDQVPDEVKSERMTRLLKFQDQISLERNMQYVGKTVRVLIDGAEIKDGSTVLSGRTDTNKRIFIKAEEEFIGNFVYATVETAKPYNLLGKLI